MGNLSLIYFTKRAREDLYQIEYYIKYEFKNAIIAKKTINNLINKILILKSFPRIEKKHENQVRFITYRKFLIFYEIQEEIIIIKTIIHSKVNL
ncbi:MAG: type II toxin-antitoxin system RelE/ParE family toxin [Clostridia bacterium]|nr:type II toxin-antitoxin system RelE/ParE family toxin [Clostridia bacterium]